MINNINNFDKFYAQMTKNGMAYYKRNEDGTKTQIVTRNDFIKTFNDAWVEKELDLMNPRRTKVSSRTQVLNSNELYEEDVKEANGPVEIDEIDSFDEDVTPDLTGIIDFTENEMSFSDEIDDFDEDLTPELTGIIGFTENGMYYSDETDDFDEDVTPELTRIFELTENGISCYDMTDEFTENRISCYDEIDCFDVDVTPQLSPFFVVTDTDAAESWEGTRTSFEAFLNDCPDFPLSMIDMMTTDTFTDNSGPSFPRTASGFRTSSSRLTA